MRASTIAAAVLALTIGCAVLSAQKPATQAPDLILLCSNGGKPAIEALLPRFERSVGRKIAAQFDSSQRLRDQIAAGEPFDVAILSTDTIDELIQQGRIAAGTRADIGRTGIGIGIRAGARKPDVSTPQALKRTLLQAKSIAMNPTGASATHFYSILDRLGITDSVKPRLMLNAEPGRPQQDVADGNAEVVFTQIPEIRFVPGVELGGPLPADLQSYTAFAAGIATRTGNSETAKALIKFITSSPAAPILKSKDVEPG
jgi:molybdate transport system substrate-binding protein